MLCLLVPWLVSVLIAEPDRGDRLRWLWPLQALVLAALASDVLSRFRSPRLLAWLVQGALLLFVGYNTLLLEKVDGWLHHSWPGPDAPEMEVVDCIATDLRARGANQVPIGYHIFFEGVVSSFSVGDEFNFVFRYRHGIANTNRCPEGISDADEYRVVQTAPTEHFLYIAHPPLPDSFYRLGIFGDYQVLKREEEVGGPMYSPGARIDFTKASSRPYLRGDWLGPEEPAQWSGSKAAVRFRLKQVQPLRLRMMAGTFQKQRIIISLNKREVRTLEADDESLRPIEVDLPPDALGKANTLTFTLPDAKSPASVGEGEDSRALGIRVAWLELVPRP
jgi:hypothetical protein